LAVLFRFDEEQLSTTPHRECAAGVCGVPQIYIKERACGDELLTFNPDPH